MASRYINISKLKFLVCYLMDLHQRISRVLNPGASDSFHHPLNLHIHIHDSARGEEINELLSFAEFAYRTSSKVSSVSEFLELISLHKSASA